MTTLLVSLLLACPIQGTDAPELTSGRIPGPEQTCFDVTRYELDIRVMPDRKAIRGEVRMDAVLLAASDELLLDLDQQLQVESVALRRGQAGAKAAVLPLSFSHSEGQIRMEVGAAFSSEGFAIAVGDCFQVVTRYAGKPRIAPRAPWDGGFQWSQTASGAPWIATSNQMQGADLWWPCKDQPNDEADGALIRVTVPKGLFCASNGALRGKSSNPDGWTTFEWEVTTPINTYGIALNIAPYEEISTVFESSNGDRFPVSYWVLPEHLDQGQILFADLLLQLRWFEGVFGPYPFRADKCGLVETPHLGMEHQSITAYGSDYSGNPWGEDQGFDFLLHHELSHEWWANLVTCRNWKDFWIHEGFATYAQSLYTEELRGPAAYRRRMGELRALILNRAPLAAREPQSSAAVYFGETGADIYNKGAWVLHSLRWLAGDEAFFRALRRMAYPDAALEATRDGSACRFTDSSEIQALAEEHTGLELDWFFEVYLYQASLPQLVTRLEEDKLHLAWELPPGVDFPMPVEVEIDGEVQRVEMPEGEATVDVKGSFLIEIDPRGWLLMSPL
jgi:aminopeptidase N